MSTGPDDPTSADEPAQLDTEGMGPTAENLADELADDLTDDDEG